MTTDVRQGLKTARLTILNSMADQSFEVALDRHLEWEIPLLDLRDAIFGKLLADLSLDEATQAAHAIDQRGLSVYCFSTTVFFDDIHAGEEVFRTKHLQTLDHVLELAKELNPHFVRLIAAQCPGRTGHEDFIDLMVKDHPWVVEVYREAIDRIAGAGFHPTIENEHGNSILSTTADFHRFFQLLDRNGTVGLTWDVLNQWSTGVFPTLETYQALRDLIVYYHVKGGKRADGTDRLAWNAALEDADWDVVAITKKVIEDEVSPIICINPTQHGELIDGYDYGDITKRDIRYLRDNVPGLS